MLKLFVAAAQLALPLCLLSAALIANRAYPPAARRRVGRLTTASLLTGAAAAAVIVWLRLTTRHIKLPAINLWAGTFLLLFLIAFVVALWLMGSRPLVADERPGPRQWLLTGSGSAALLLVNLFYGIPLYLAIDGVVPMGGTLFASDSLINLIGYVLGVVVAVATGIVFSVSLGRMPSLARRALTTTVVGIAVATQWPALYQLYSTARVLPKSSLNFQALLWMQRAGVTVLLALLALVVVAATLAYLTRQRHAAPGAVAAEHRLVKAEALSRRRVLGGAIALGLGLGLTYTVGKKLAEAVPELSPIEPSTVNGAHVEVDLSLVSDGHLHRFAYPAQNGTEVRFIVIQKNPTSFGTGLDACEICGPSGYYERDGKVVCRECDVIMNTATIGFPGGCNPIPIQYELAGGKLLFQVDELEQQARVFG
ncbi:MAG TPA: DUF2318 domain-containing protein [Arachnia sp.]|nr:DUF2318 domain-containing protein [Arachnia sp.]HMT86632.1 DUF2318 domain-containing protein [Arachnia sp.]